VSLSYACIPLLTARGADLNIDEAVPEVVVSFATIDEQLLPRR
jgi:hypothetical protein